MTTHLEDPADGPRRGNLPPPAPVEPEPHAFRRGPVLDWFRGVSWIAVVLAHIVATVFKLHLVGGLRLPAMIRRPGAQPTVVEAPMPYPYAAPVDGPLRMIRRVRVGAASWTLFTMLLIAGLIVRGPAA